jgi:transketolase
MAFAERLLSTEFNRPGHAIVDHRTFVFLGDGCLMEGVSHEAASLAGTWKLGKLVAIYDDNGISIDGHVKGWFTDDTPARFEAYGWRVIRGVDGHDSDAVDAAITAATVSDGRPTLVCCRTIIGHGAPNKEGTHDVHGAPLGAAEIAATRKAIGWDHPPFEVPADIYAQWDGKAKGAALEAEWQTRFDAYRAAHPALAAELTRRVAGTLPADWSTKAEAIVTTIEAKAETIATRKASQNCIEALSPVLPEMLGGSADLTGSNLTNWSGTKSIGREGGGNYVHYGVREFGMTAIMNGMALHGGYIPFGGTFLIFSDYARNALRMAALMKLRSILVFTHDSIGLGEDGPTHQPIEQLASLRLIPNMDVWRPCDTVECAVAWVAALERRDGPSSLALSRQNLPFVARDAATRAQIRRGGYVLKEAAGTPAAVLIATGSEVDLAIKAQAALAEAGLPVRVVSMPASTVFDRQDETYRASVLPAGVVRIAIEAGVTAGWRKYVGLEGAVIGLDHFGASAPAGALFKEFGFTVEHVLEVVRSVVRPA